MAATAVRISIVPANRASPEDLAAVFGSRGDPSRCQCQWFKIRRADWRSVPREERARGCAPRPTAAIPTPPRPRG